MAIKQNPAANLAWKKRQEEENRRLTRLAAEGRTESGRTFAETTVLPKNAKYKYEDFLEKYRSIMNESTTDEQKIDKILSARKDAYVTRNYYEQNAANVDAEKGPGYSTGILKSLDERISDMDAYQERMLDKSIGAQKAESQRLYDIQQRKQAAVATAKLAPSPVTNESLTARAERLNAEARDSAIAKLSGAMEEAKKDPTTPFARIPKYADYAGKAAQGAAIPNPAPPSGLQGMSIAGWKPFAPQIENKAHYYRDNPAQAMADAEGALYTNMTEDEVGIYDYLLSSDKENGSDEADKYFDALRPRLNARVSDKTQGVYAGLAEKNPVGASAVSVATNVLSGAGYLKAAGGAILGKEVDPNDPAFGASKATSTIRETVGENIKEGVGGGAVGDVAKFVYNGLASVADSLTTAGIAKGVGAAGKIVSGFIFGTNAGSGATLDALDKGADSTQALWSGFASGLAEVVFEEISLDRFIQMTDAGARKALLKNILKQSGVEASEEAATEISNILTDALILGNKGDMNRLYEQYIADGMSEADAKTKAAGELIGRVALAGAGGAFSGGLMGGVGTAISTISSQAGDVKTPKAPIQQGKGGNRSFAEEPTTIAKTGDTVTGTRGLAVLEQSALEQPVQEVPAMRNAEIKTLEGYVAEEAAAPEEAFIPEDQPADIMEAIAQQAADEQISQRAEEPASLQEPASEPFFDDDAANASNNLEVSEDDSQAAESTSKPSAMRNPFDVPFKEYLAALKQSDDARKGTQESTAAPAVDDQANAPSIHSSKEWSKEDALGNEALDKANAQVEAAYKRHANKYFKARTTENGQQRDTPLEDGNYKAVELIDENDGNYYNWRSDKIKVRVQSTNGKAQTEITLGEYLYNVGDETALYDIQYPGDVVRKAKMNAAKPVSNIGDRYSEPEDTKKAIVPDKTITETAKVLGDSAGQRFTDMYAGNESLTPAEYSLAYMDAYAKGKRGEKYAEAIAGTRLTEKAFTTAFADGNAEAAKGREAVDDGYTSLTDGQRERIKETLKNPDKNSAFLQQVEADVERLSEKQTSKPTKSEKYGRNGSTAYSKWIENEYVNIKPSTGDPREGKFKRFFDKYYNAGRNGTRTTELPFDADTDTEFPEFLQDVFYRAGVKDASTGKPAAPAKNTGESGARLYPADKTNLPYDVVIEKLDTSKYEQGASLTKDASADTMKADEQPTTKGGKRNGGTHERIEPANDRETSGAGQGSGTVLAGVVQAELPKPSQEGPAGSVPVLRGAGDDGAQSSGGHDAGRHGGGRGDGDRSGVSDADAGERLTQETPEQAIKRDTERKTAETPKGSNYAIGESLNLPSGEKSRYKANVEAIRTVKRLIAEGRYATTEEQETLSRYVGWGGIANAFDESKSEWAKEYAELKGLLTNEEYESARGSTLNAHYTSIEVIRAMYNALGKLGFEGGRMLEPASGVGNFVGAMPAEMRGKVKSWTMVELDQVTGSIAKYLYPNNDVRVQGFEAAIIPDNYMDVAVGNVPFGNYGVTDKRYSRDETSSIHNYFFAKTLDKVRPGGVVMFITSRYTMDGRDNGFRAKMAGKADLLGAVRLPDTAFKGNAGTEVVTDILVLRKRDANTPSLGESFADVKWETLAERYEEINEYYQRHPEMVLGTPERTGSMYGKNQLTYKAKPGDLAQQIEDALGTITEKMVYPKRPSAETTARDTARASSGGKEGQYVHRNGKIYQVLDGLEIQVQADAAQATKIAGMIAIRDQARALLSEQMTGADASKIAKGRKQLNDAYNAFVKENGYINAPNNRRLVADDVDAPFLLALENYDKNTKTATKADIFTKDTVTPRKTVTHVNDATEGLVVSVNETGDVDMPMIARLTGTSEAEVESTLSDAGLVFMNREGAWETAERYLSGNVKAKLRDARALAEMDRRYQKNVDALEKVVPKDISYGDIYVKPGATWVPPEVYTQFVTELLKVYGYGRRVQVQYAAGLGEYVVKLDARSAGSVENRSTYGSKARSFDELFEAVLNNRQVTVRYKTEDGTSHVDQEATIEARAKMEEITDTFKEWVWKDEARRDQLSTLYNEVFNNTVTPKYDGSNLTVDGANPAKSLKPHQRDVVQRIVSSGGNTLIAHKVGAGKTGEMAAAAMKLRQLGIVKKPLFVVPKNVLAQWGKEFLSFFPTARILIPNESDFTAANRRTFMNKIATGDYDAVIVSQENFSSIPVSGETQGQFLQEQINELMAAIEAEKLNKAGSSITVKQMEKRKKQLEAKLGTLGDLKKDVGNIDFESLGVDSLFVDEAHSYKNLFYSTHMNNVSGLSNKDGAKRSFDMYMKVRWLQQLNAGRGIVFATATPIMNSMSEMYIMQKYLQGDALKQRGLDTFDAWANTFGEVVNVMEMNPSGMGYRQKQSFCRFKNLGELQQMFRSFTDVLTDVPGLKIPKLKGGKRTTVVCAPSDFQLDYIQKLSDRADAVKNGVDPRIDNMLKITSEGRKLSYSQRMIDPSLPYEADGKINKLVGSVYDKWVSTKATKGTQLVFCDMATPKGSSQSADADTGAEDAENADIYNDVRRQLILKGIPAKEIAFIHDADTNEKKESLFADVNAGRVRVLIGSTGKMGVGMNAQQRVVALHHLDAPWRPGDIEQREGRALRQGNMNDEVEIFVYVTEKTFDARMWDTLERKSSFISDVMNGNTDVRETEDVGELTLSAAEIKSIASGNPMIMEQFEVTADITKLKALKNKHSEGVMDATREKRDYLADIANAKAAIPKFKADAAKAADVSGDEFSIIVNGETYTDRKAAGAAIIRAASAAAKKGSTKIDEIGTFAGFELSVMGDGTIFIRGQAPHNAKINPDSPIGTIQSMEATLKGMKNATEKLEARIAEANERISKLDELINAPYARQAELDKAMKRNREIMDILNPSKASEQVLDEGAEVENMLYSLNALTANHGDVPFTVRGGSSNSGNVENLIRTKPEPKNKKIGYKVFIVKDGKLYPPMAMKGKATPVGVWLDAEIAPTKKNEDGSDSLTKNGRPRMDIGGGQTLAFRPGWHLGELPYAPQFYETDKATGERVQHPNFVWAECEYAADVDYQDEAMSYGELPSGKFQHSLAGLPKLPEDGYYKYRTNPDPATIPWAITGAMKVNRLLTDDEVDGVLRENGIEPMKRAGGPINLGKYGVTQTDYSGNKTENMPRSNMLDTGGTDQWQTERAGADRPVVGIDAILRKARQKFGLPITSGHIRGSQIRGQYNQQSVSIRTKIANDLPAASHEIGHYLNAKFKLLREMSLDAKNELLRGLDPEIKAAFQDNPNQMLSEAFAEYLRKYLQNRETAQIDFPGATLHMKNTLDADTLNTIDELADDVNAYYSLGADTAQPEIMTREEAARDKSALRDKLAGFKDRLYLAWNDANLGIRKFDKAAGSKAYMHASNSAYAEAVSGQAIVGELRDMDGRRVSDGLQAALSGVNVGNKKEYAAFGEYLVVKHGPERLREGMRVFANDMKNSSVWMERRRAELEREYPAFSAASDRLYAYQSDFLQAWGVDTGLVSAEAAKEWAKRWQHYVPFNRAMEADGNAAGARRGYANQDSTIRKARGSGRSFVHPVDNIITNVTRMVNAAMRNRVMVEMVNATEGVEGLGRFMEPVPAPLKRTTIDLVPIKNKLMDSTAESGVENADAFMQLIQSFDDVAYQYEQGKARGDVVTVLRGGKQEFYKVNDPLLMQSLVNMSPKQANAVMDGFSRITRFITSNITGRNVVWSIFSNMPRDIGTYMAYSKDKNPLHLFGGIASAYLNKFKGDNASDLYKEYLAMGGGKTSAYTADKNLQRNIRKEFAGDKKHWLNPLEWLDFVSDMVESGPRFATYKIMRERYGMTPQEAFYESTDITVNFRRGGTVSRQVNKIIPFFNASVQGLDKFTRWISAEEMPPAQRKKTAAIRAAGFTVASLALAALIHGINSGDDEKKKQYAQLSAFTKNAYFCIPLGDGKYFAIPKPREIAALASLFERGLEYYANENKNAFKGFYTYATDTMLPNAVSGLAQLDVNDALSSMGIFGVFNAINANKDFLGRPIESMSMANLEPKARFTQRTSKAAKAIGEWLNVSPVMTDYALQNLFGGFWKWNQALFPIGDEHIDYTLGVKRSYIKDSLFSNDSPDELYVNLEAADQARSSDASGENMVVYKLLYAGTNFYSNYQKLSRTEPETDETRAKRQVVLDVVSGLNTMATDGAFTKEARALADYVQKNGGTDQYPTAIDPKVKDAGGAYHELTSSQYADFTTDYLGRYWNYIGMALGKPETANEEGLRVAKNKARAEANANILAQIGAESSEASDIAAYRNAGVTSEQAYDFAAKKAIANADGSFTREELLGIIDGMNAGEQESRYFYAEGIPGATITSNPYTPMDELNKYLLTADPEKAKASVTGTYKDLIIQSYMNGETDKYQRLSGKLYSLELYDKKGFPYYTPDMIEKWISDYVEKLAP